MTKPTQEQWEQVKQDRGPKSSYMMIRLGYGDGVIVPYAQGVQIIQALEFAETYKPDYGNHRIESLDPEQVTTVLITEERYQMLKMAKLLGVKIDELEKSMKEEEEEEAT